jgi:hypothetical protein
MSAADEKLSDPGVVEKSGSHYPISNAKTTQRRPWWKLGGKDISFAPVDPDSVTTSNTGSVEDIETTGLDNIHGSVFDDSGAAQFYQPIDKYEGKHRFDPNATWTPEEEQRLVRKVSSRRIHSLQQTLNLILNSLTGGSACQHVPSSSPCSWIEVTSHKLCPTTC